MYTKQTFTPFIIGSIAIAAFTIKLFFLIAFVGVVGLTFALNDVNELNKYDHEPKIPTNVSFSCFDQEKMPSQFNIDSMERQLQGGPSEKYAKLVATSSPRCWGQLGERPNMNDFKFEDGLRLISCYDSENDQAALKLTADMLTDIFPNHPLGYFLLGEQQISSGELTNARETFDKALKLDASFPLKDELSAQLHNNYAWLLLEEGNPDLDLVEKHVKEAIEKDGRDCAIIHTYLTYEFARAMSQPADTRDLEPWMDVRVTYDGCVRMFNNAQHENAEIGRTELSQLVSTIVMDSLATNSEIEVTPMTVSYLLPAKKYIEEDGVKRFCLSAMGVADYQVQETCRALLNEVKASW